MKRDPERVSQPAESIVDRAWREERPGLVSLATRMLSDRAAAEDVVQDAFDRLSRQPAETIDNVGAWLTVVVRRLAVNSMTSAYARHEDASGEELPEQALQVPLPGADQLDPADRVTLDDQVQLALSIMLARLSPAERTSFVLHDVFGFAFDEVAEIVGRTPAACRQLASRARRSVHGADPAQVVDVEPAARSLVAERFIAACSSGRLEELLAVLDPDVVGEAELFGGGPLGRREGSDRVARRTLDFFGPGTGVSLVPVVLDGREALVALADGRPFGVMEFEESGGRMHYIHVYVSRHRLE